jgi:hypothetical protein
VRRVAGGRQWRRLNASDHLVDTIRGVRFRDSEPVTAAED